LLEKKGVGEILTRVSLLQPCFVNGVQMW